MFEKAREISNNRWEFDIWGEVDPEETLPQEEFDFHDESSDGAGNYDDMSVVCAALSRLLHTEEDIIKLAEFFQILNRNKLVKTFYKVLDDPEKSSEYISAFVNKPDSEISKIIERGYEDKAGDIFKSSQLELWSRGEMMVELGSEMEQITEQAATYLNVKRTEKLTRSAARYKESQLENAVNAIINCFSTKVKVALKTFPQKLEFIKKKLQLFEAGKSIGVVDTSLFSYPSEAGIMQPHTLDPKEWIVKVTSDFLRNQFGQVCIAYCDASTPESRVFTDDDRILYTNRDLDHPLHWNHTPAFTDDRDDDGNWEWRNDVEKVSTMVASMISEGDSRPRHEISRECELKLAERFTLVSNVTVGKVGYKVDLTTGESYQFIAVYKRGNSKLDEITANPSYVHVTSTNIALTLNSKEFVPFTLSDNYTVVLIPSVLWSLSHGARTGKKVIGRTARYGLLSVTNNFLAFWSAMVHLGCTFKMIAALRGEGPYVNPLEYWEPIHAHLLANKYKYLTGKRSYDPSWNGNVLMRTIPGLSAAYGLYVFPETSKIGKRVKSDEDKFKRYNDEGDSLNPSALFEEINEYPIPKKVDIFGNLAKSQDKLVSDKEEEIREYQSRNIHDMETSLTGIGAPGASSSIEVMESLLNEVHSSGVSSENTDTDPS